MYKEIDELIDVIVNDEVFKHYVKDNQLLKDKDIQSLLIKHQNLQDDYLKLKQYESYISIDETKQKLKEVKHQLSSHPYIQQYYQSYYELNDLLEEVTRIVFQNISDSIEMNRWMI